MKKSSKIKQDNSFSLFGFLLESKVAFFVIITNIAIFVFLQDMSINEGTLSRLVLYPGNIMQGNLLCIITSGFLHHNWTHLLLNMLGVFVFARVVERRLGIMKTFYIYIGSLIISMLFATGFYAFVLHRNIGIIGASGAVMGLVGAAMLLDPFRISYEMILPLPVMVKGWLFLSADLKGFLGGEKDGVSHLAHLFGFLSIMFLMYFLSHEDKRRMRAGLLINIISFVVFLVLKQKLGH